MNDTSREKVRPSSRTFLVCHGVLLAFLVLLYVFVVPVFMEMYADFGDIMPRPTQLVGNASSWACMHWIIVGVVVVVLLWLDLAFYLYCWRHFRRAIRITWFWAGILLLSLMIPATVFMMFIPIFMMRP